MSVFFRQPAMNVFRFAEADKVQDDRYGYPAFGTALHKDDLKPDHVKWDFFHHVTRTQPICIQYHRSKMDTYDPTELYITDMKGKLLKMINPTSSYTHPGIVTDKGEQLYTEQFQFNIAQYAELDNYEQLCFKLRVYYSNNASPLGFIVRDYRCDPLEIADKWDEHCFYEYSHPNNEANIDVLFEELRPLFTCYIPSTGMKQVQGGKYTVYQNQIEKSIRLYGVTVDNALWDIGGKEGLPMYYIDALHDATTLSKQRIDGRFYTRIGEDFEENGTSDKGREFRKLMMQHKENILEFGRGLVQCWPIPATYPHAIGSHLLTDGIRYIGYAGGKMFNNSGEVDTYITALNTYVSGIGVGGQFSRVDGYVVFLNAQGDTFDLLSAVKVMPNMLELSVSVANTVQPFTYSLGYITNYPESHVIVYGAVSGTEELKRSTVTNFGSSFTNFANVSKVFSSTGNKTVRIFTGDTETSFNSERSFPQPVTPQPKIINMNTASNISRTLQSFRLSNHDLSAIVSLSLDFLKNAKDTLKYITLERCLINDITPGWANALISGLYKPYRLLYGVEITYNKLTSASVDGILNEVHLKTNWSPGFKYIRLQGNSPAAPKTATSNAAWDAMSTGSLVYNGYSVTTD